MILCGPQNQKIFQQQEFQVKNYLYQDKSWIQLINVCYAFENPLSF